MPRCRYSQTWLFSKLLTKGQGKRTGELTWSITSEQPSHKEKASAKLSSRHSRELKQQRRQRLPKRHLKSEVALLQTLSLLFHLVQFVKCWQFFLELNSKWIYRSSGKEKENRLSLLCLVFTFSTKREIFSRRSRAVMAKKYTKKRDARAQLLFCQCKRIPFLPFLLTSSSSFRKLASTKVKGAVSWKWPILFSVSYGLHLSLYKKMFTTV